MYKKMSGTIETTNNNIKVKINSILEIIEIFKKTNVSIDNKIIKDINEIKEEYEMGTINILSEYFLLSSSNTNNILDNDTIIKEKNILFKKYRNFIKKENFINKLDRLINSIKINMKTLEDNLDLNQSSSDNNPIYLVQEIYKHLKNYNNLTVNKIVKEVIYEKCSCSEKMHMDSVSSTLICKKCGITKQLYGTVFEDDQFYSQEGQRTKHGTYDPSNIVDFGLKEFKHVKQLKFQKQLLIVLKNVL